MTKSKFLEVDIINAKCFTFFLSHTHASTIANIKYPMLRLCEALLSSHAYTRYHNRTCIFHGRRLFDRLCSETDFFVYSLLIIFIKKLRNSHKNVFFSHALVRLYNKSGQWLNLRNKTAFHMHLLLPHAHIEISVCIWQQIRKMQLEFSWQWAERIWNSRLALLFSKLLSSAKFQWQFLFWLADFFNSFLSASEIDGQFLFWQQNSKMHSC